MVEDHDFSALMAREGAVVVPMILMRVRTRSASRQAELIVRHLPETEPHLIQGAVVVITDSRARTHRRPS